MTRTTTSTMTTPTMKTTITTMRRMTTRTTMTTDQRRGVTARTRILAWIMLVLTIAVFVIVLSTARAELSRVKVQADEELQHEADKFRNFASKPDPSDGRPYTSVQKLMTNHLQTNLPEQSETIFSIVDGKEDQRSVDDPPVRPDKDHHPPSPRPPSASSTPSRTSTPSTILRPPSPRPANSSPAPHRCPRRRPESSTPIPDGSPMRSCPCRSKGSPRRRSWSSSNS